MKKVFLLFFGVIFLASACGASPRETAKDFASYLPLETTSWEQQDNRTIQLRQNTVTSMGHVTLEYEGPDDAIAWVTIEAHPSTDAADVAYGKRQRDLLMQGLEFEDSRAGTQVKAEIARKDRATWVLFISEDVVVEVDILSGSADELVSEDSLEELLQAVRNAYDKIEGKKVK